MASSDVLRGLARRRLSYVDWFRYGAIHVASRDLKKRLAPSNGASQNLDRRIFDMSLVAECAELASSFEMGGEGRGEGALTATMASKDHIPTPEPPSGDLTGGGRDGEHIHLHHPSICLSSHFSSNQEDDCFDRLSALTLSTDETSSPAWSRCVTDLLDVLQQFGVTSTPVPYRPQEERSDSTEIFCKNLFLKDKRGQFFLIICDENQNMDLKLLRRKVKAYRNFTFATPEEMSAILHVHPGGVTPFALMHETARDVRVVMTTDLTSDSDALLNFHPLDQNLTLPLQLVQLEQFLQCCGVDLELIDTNN